MENESKTTETMSDYVERRIKEILSSGGHDWREFDMQEKVIAMLQAEGEWRSGQRI